MKMIIAKVHPENDELLCDLYSRMKESIDVFIEKHQDTSIHLVQDVTQNCVLVKSLKLGESAN